MKYFIAYIKKHYIISIISTILIFILIVGSIFIFNNGQKFETVSVVRQSVAQVVSVTGSVKPSDSVDMAFERSGTVSNVYADVGKQVKVGDTIVALQSLDLVGDLSQAQAQLLKEQVKLDNLKAGNRSESIAISQSQLDNAKAVVTAADTTAINAINDAYSKSDDAVRYHTDKFFNNPGSYYPTLVFSTNNSDLTNKIQKTRIDLEFLLNDFLSETQNISASSNVGSILESTVKKLDTIKSYLDNLATGVNSLVANISISQANIDIYKADMSAARLDISAAISEVTSALNARNNALAAFATAQSQFSLQKAGNIQADIDAQNAQVKSQEGLVEIKQAALAKNFLRSPIDGIISRQDAKVGQIAPAGVVLVSIISNSEFQIEANIPEANISKVHVGDDATVTLDAYQDGSIFDASVIKIDPAETVVDGVPTYKITFEFKKVDDRIKSGMTANVSIVSSSKPDALVIPQRVIFNDTEGSYVRVLKNNTPVITRIKIGVKGSNGIVEVVQGLSEGDSVIVSP